MPSVQIYDTTLRDGTQSEGISFSSEDKVRVARYLDRMGFHYIEGGWPGSNPKDLEFFQKIRSYTMSHAKIAAFGATRRPNIKVEDDESVKAILDAATPVATLVGKSWDFHVSRALGTTLEENLAMIRETVAYLKGHGLEVVYDAEHFFDGYKANPDYALATIKAAQEGGASTICLCDTNGGSLPLDVLNLVRQVKNTLDIPLGIHVHNDGEMAVANTLMAVEGGVVQVQGTINGYGERCGNANLCSIIPNLSLKCGIDTIPEKNLKKLVAMSNYISEMANVSPNPHQPYVGMSAFAHKGGIHVSALLKSYSTYEHIDPALVGNKRRVLVSELSGLSNLLYKYKELNLDVDQQNEEGMRLLEEIKQMENQGFQFEGAEGSFVILLRKAFDGYQQPFSLEALRLITEIKENNPAYSEAIIKMKMGDQVVHTAAEGNGPVNALDNAVRKALDEFYPEISNMHLTDYKVRVLDEKDGTGAMVRVHIETSDGKRSWGTVGVSNNIIEASWQALVDSVAYGLLEEGTTQSS